MFEPDYRLIIDAASNRKPARLPLYEDVIAPYDRWIEEYGDRIGLFGGIDIDRLCRMKPDEIYDFVLKEGMRFRSNAKGYALGSGNSIPDYVPVDGYLAMVRAAQTIRQSRRRITV